MSKRTTIPVPPAPPIRTKKIKRNLQYQFTDEERIALGKELGEATLKLGDIERDKKMVVDEWKAKESSQAATVGSLANKCSSGYEYRDIPCTVTLNDPIVGQKCTRRDDT